MKILRFWAIILISAISSYSYSGMSANASETENAISLDDKDKAEIKQLIRKALKWVDKESSLHLYPLLKENPTGFYLGFDLDEHKKNLKKLESSQFFSAAFFDNYNNIYQALDRKLRDKEIEWRVGELPPFGNNANPWCNCQDVPYDKPNPWESIEVDFVGDENGRVSALWTWGSLKGEVEEELKKHPYRFDVVKEKGKWKIDYLEGFDFDVFTSVDEPVGSQQNFDKFKAMLDNCGMTFQEPDGVVECDIVENGDMNYEYALTYPDKDFEVRYSIRPITYKHYENDSLRSQIEESKSFRNESYETILQAIIFNISGKFYKVGPFDQDAVKEEFNADWGGTTFVELKDSGFGKGFKYCMVVAIHKNDVADAYYFYLANTKDKYMDRMMPLFHSLQFE